MTKAFITVSISKESTELIIYGSEWGPLFISSLLKAQPEHNQFRALLIQVNHEWHPYFFTGVDDMHEGAPALKWIKQANNESLDLTKNQFIEKCNNKEVALYDNNQFNTKILVTPRCTLPLIFTSPHGPDITWTEQQFAEQCNSGNVAFQRLNAAFQRKRRVLVIGQRKTTHPVQVKILNDGSLHIARMVNYMNGKIWCMTLKPQGKYYLELRNKRNKWKKYQLLGAFIFEDGDAKIVITNVGMSDKEDETRVFVWSEQELIDQCHGGNVAIMCDEYSQGIDVHCLAKKKKEMNQEDKIQITIACVGAKKNIFGIKKRTCKTIDKHYPFYIQHEP
eukprot:484826_1